MCDTRPMAVNPNFLRTRGEAQRSLARLFERKLGVTIDPEKLGKVILDYWGLVSSDAHAIHAAAITPAPQTDEQEK